jgi:hypothetical protein
MILIIAQNTTFGLIKSVEAELVVFAAKDRRNIFSTSGNIIMQTEMVNGY